MQELQDIAVLDLLPQRPPFIMVDRLTYFTREKTTTEFKVLPDNIFFEDGCLSAYGLIENIAQTCAARMGYINYLNKDSIKLGFIGALSDTQVFRLPKADELLVTSIEVKEEIFQMTLVDAVVKSNDEVLMTSKMKIALSDIDSQI
ncbi:pseudouridylate synthase [Porphyromonadaceae bacterium OttesenSCG-928-L07]|nr:pseudouridylate synthase [Porphyromonadaceae bacterium OttesenSCG-928-L07]MDL2252007.1 pseudouridylate synthase [Odoribacter sp. OttesenSCG-928-J03]MDL2331235.1 pseudouridylate synthase [Odoribacter sp. OttesenSCG-928-A06]